MTKVYNIYIYLFLFPEIPLSKDVVTFQKFLNEDILRLTDSLGNSEEIDGFEYRKLAEVTLAKVTTFNRRRQGEMSMLTVKGKKI